MINWLRKLEKWSDPLFAPIGENDRHVDFWFQLGTWRAALLIAAWTAAIILGGAVLRQVLLRFF